jgi:hypothetical protein
MRAHTEVDDTVWSFVKVFLQFLVQKIILKQLFLNNLENMSCTVLQICVVLFYCAYMFKQILNTKSY